MKYLFVACILALLPLSIRSQEYDLSNLRGIKDKDGNVLFEMSGYNITTRIVKGAVIDESVINAMKEKFGMDSILSEYSDFYINAENRIIEAEKGVQSKHDLKWNQICYLVSDSINQIAVIYFQTMNQRDIALEQTFVDTYLNGGFKDSISDMLDTHTVSFAGRTLSLDSNTKIVGPNSIESYEFQMSWSQFDSFESAMLDINARIQANDNRRMVIVEEGDIDVVFEGVPSLAHRVVYNSMGYFETIYYIVQEVRGYNLACVLSCYGYTRRTYELPSSLKQVMDISVIPQAVLDSSDYDSSDGASNMNVFEIQAGTWLPQGNLSNAFTIAPSFGAFMAFPVKRNMAIDIGLQMAFPTNKKTFDFYRYGEIYETKATLLFDICLRLRYQKMIARDVFFNTYIGAGVNSIETDLEKDYDYEESDSYLTSNHYFSAPDLLGGVSLRHKKVGCFLEYHYTPYSISNKVKAGFGNSAINIGLVISFLSR